MLQRPLLYLHVKLSYIFGLFLVNLLLYVLYKLMRDIIVKFPYKHIAVFNSICSHYRAILPFPHFPFQFLFPFSLIPLPGSGVKNPRFYIGKNSCGPIFVHGLTWRLTLVFLQIPWFYSKKNISYALKDISFISGL